MKTEWERVKKSELIQFPEKDELEPLLKMLQELDFLYDFNNKLKIISQKLDNG